MSLKRCLILFVYFNFTERILEDMGRYYTCGGKIRMHSKYKYNSIDDLKLQVINLLLFQEITKYNIQVK